MSQKRKTKEEIVAEYLTGNYTYRELGLKYDVISQYLRLGFGISRPRGLTSKSRNQFLLGH